MSRIVLFIPVYNEAEKLGEILKRLPQKIQSYPAEIVVADDCSADNSVEIASQFTDHIVCLPENGGVGAATRAGFEYIAGKFDEGYVIKFDGDGQHDLSLLPLVAGKLKTNDIVICSRFHPLSDQTHTPTDRILLNMIFTEMLRKITGWKLTDVRSGFMGFHMEDIHSIASQIVVQRYGIPMELLLRIWHKRPEAAVLEIPHPAMYEKGISRKLDGKYSSEQLGEKTDRLQIAYAALLQIIEDLKIPREKILEMNGFNVAA